MMYWTGIKMKLKMETSLGDYTFWIYIYRQTGVFLEKYTFEV